MKLSTDDKVGILLTVIVHLVILIVLLIAQIGFSIQEEHSFVLDFSKQEEHEKIVRQEAFDNEIDRRIDEMISGESGIPFRNVTVSRNKGTLKDDRGTDADKLYEDAERLAMELKQGQKVKIDEDFVELPKNTDNQGKKSETNYSGPSVLSWHLDGRKASHLPIPAYRCYSGGMVTVIISVDTSGKVVDAKVLEEASSEDSCLRAFAVRAAMMSRFSSSPAAASRETGDIVYQFIAQ